MRVDWRAILAGLAVTAGAAACGAAVDVRDRTAGCEARIDKAEAVRAERDAAMLERLDALRCEVREIRADLKAARISGP